MENVQTSMAVTEIMNQDGALPPAPAPPLGGSFPPKCESDVEGVTLALSLNPSTDPPLDCAPYPISAETVILACQPLTALAQCSVFLKFWEGHSRNEPSCFP